MLLTNLYKARKLINNISPQRFVALFGVFSRYYSMDEEMSGGNWRGVPLSEIVGSQSSWGAPEFPLITPGYNHAVLYHIPNSGNMGDRPPKPQVGQDKWDNDYVRMPCSSKSLYPVDDENGETRLKKRWGMIEEALNKPIMNSKQLADAILSYNSKFKSIWKFRALHHLFNNYLDEQESQYFFTVTLPQIAELALDLPKHVQAPIPLLKQDKTRSISLSQQQISSLLANAFFCTFPRRNTAKRNSEYSNYPHINFSTLYESEEYDDVMEKLKCLCHYFRRVCAKVPTGACTFSRRAVPLAACPRWECSLVHISTLPVHVDSDGRIEDADGLIQLDFANKFLGGGVLGHGSVQEEIRFVVCPELIVSMLFTEVLKANEAMLMIGCERYSEHIGYSRTFQWSNDYKDRTPFDSAGRRRVAVLAIDALPYASKAQEYRREMLSRELNKAWIGFSFFTEETPYLQYPGIATGNWGCGAFGGTPQLKSLLQIMACAHARRPMAYYTFGDNEIRDDVINMYNVLARYNVTVGQLYQYIVKFAETDVRRSQLHSYLQQIILDEQKKKQSTKPVHMETGESPKTIQQKAIEKELLNDSPDLFSQDEYQSLNESDKHKNTPTHEQSSKNDMAPKESKMADQNKTEENKMAPQTSRLFEQMNKFDDENGKLKLNTSVDDKKDNSKYFQSEKPKTDESMCIDAEMNDSIENKASSSRINESTADKLDNENKTPSTSRLFDEMEKFDEEHGMLDLSSPHSTPLCDKKLQAKDSDATLTDKVELTSEFKKKITRKITDYFSKKSL